MKSILLMNSIAFEIGPLAIHWYGVIIATGVLLAVFLGMREAQRRQINSDAIIDMMLWALPIAFVGARLYYVIFEWPYYLKNPSEIIKIWHGGIAIYGGLIAGGIVVYFFTKKKNLPVWLILDIAAPAVMIAQAIGRWGNFVNQEAFGGVTTLNFLESLHLPQFIIENMFIDGAYRQPTFLYESLWNILGFVIIMSIRHHKGWFKQGEIALCYVAWYAFGRFFVERMRTDSLMMFNAIRVSQLLSVFLFVGAIGLWIYRRKKYPENLYYLDGNQQKGVYYKAK